MSDTASPSFNAVDTTANFAEQDAQHISEIYKSQVKGNDNKFGHLTESNSKLNHLQVNLTSYASGFQAYDSQLS